MISLAIFFTNEINWDTGFLRCNRGELSRALYPCRTAQVADYALIQRRILSQPSPTLVPWQAISQFHIVEEHIELNYYSSISYIAIGCSYRKLLTLPKPGKEVAQSLLEFFTAFVMLWIGWKTVGRIVSFFGILAR